jgi:hypothetical protein
LIKYGAKNKIWDGVITLKVQMETQLKISTTFDTLCGLYKCGAGLEINKKMKENIESH